MARSRLLLLVLTGLLVVAGLPSLPGAGEAGAAQRSITFSVGTRGSVQADVATFREIVQATLDDPRGWSLGGALEYELVSSGGDFHVLLASPREVERAAPVCSAYYSCTVGDDVLINDERWRRATDSWPYSLHSYRHYVVNHEVGHWLDLGHRECPGQGRPAPVMQQQSISLDGCEATVWPLRDERLAVARNFGVRPALPFDRAAVVRPDGADLVWIATDDTQSPGRLRTFIWGRPTKDDVPVVGDWNGDGLVTAGVARPDGRDWLWLLTDAVDEPRLDHALRWGRPTKDDVPVVGDWNGDGRDTPGVVRPDGPDLQWLLNNRTASPRLSHDVRWGLTSDRAVPGDWDGDGVDTPGIVRPDGADLVWSWTDDLDAAQQSHEFRWGRPTKDDVPVAGRWAL